MLDLVLGLSNVRMALVMGGKTVQLDIDLVADKHYNHMYFGRDHGQSIVILLEVIILHIDIDIECDIDEPPCC